MAARADNPYEGKYQQTATGIGCASGGCTITFSAVAADTLILNVSCQLTFEASGSITEAQLTFVPTVTPYIAALPIFAYPSGTIQGINATTYFFVAKGHKPQLFVGGTASGLSAVCTLSGNQS